MTKEDELKKEAEEHCNEVLCSVCENGTCTKAIKCREWRDIRAGYYCGAESREEHIEELEKENERLKGDLELWESGGCRATNLFECGVVKELKDQLTKAKNLIKNIIRVTWGEGWNYSLDWKVKAEQFIKEIEK